MHMITFILACYMGVIITFGSEVCAYRRMRW